MRASPRTYQCLVKIKDALFKTDAVGKSAPIFPTKVNFEVWDPNSSPKPSSWAITGPHKEQFLSIVSGKHFADPKLSRTYPFIAKSFKYNRIAYLDFRESSGLDKVHMSARYESYSYKGALEMADDVNSVRNYITGSNNYNSNSSNEVDPELVDSIIQQFNLDHLGHKWINSLSNGQMRRARLAKAIITKPSLLIINDPFLGLDPTATDMVSKSLHDVTKSLGISTVLGLRVQDSVPKWVSHLGYVNSEGLIISGPKDQVEDAIASQTGVSRTPSQEKQNWPRHSKKIHNDELSDSQLHIQFTNASVAYRGAKVLDKFSWNIPAGSKWRILGDNGTGKTTILSLITADHPQSWRSVLAIDGVTRTSGAGITYFSTNNEIGISSPELHALVPSQRTAAEIVYNGLVRNIGNSNFLFRGKPNEYAKSILSQFPEFEAIKDKKFVELSVTEQKLVLFLRAVVKKPRLLILDEAFSCMDDPKLLARCHELVANLDATVLAIGHIDWELPRLDYVLKLTGDSERSYEIHQYQ